MIQNLSCAEWSIPLKVPFRQANQETQTSASVIVQIETREGVLGFGESCPRAYVSGESLYAVRRGLILIKPFLIGQSLASLEEVPELLDLVRPHLGPAALCGLELALLDAWGKEQNQSLFELMSDPHPQTFAYAGVIPIGPVEKLRPILSGFQFSEVKIKVGPDRANNQARLNLVRECFGPEVAVRVDANTGWSLTEAQKEIPFWLAQGVNIFEQIFPPAENENMLKIMQNFGHEAYFVADESLTCLDSAKRLLENRICNRLNLKISKHGGIFQSLAIYDYAKSHGVSCQLGAHYGETGLLTSAGLLFSALRKEVTAREGAYGTHLLEKDICDPSLKFDHRGELSLPFPNMGTGLGLKIMPEVLKD